MLKLSCVVITWNEEKNIDRCLKSLSWADEIILVDSISSDRTVEFARRYTDRIISHPYDGDIHQRERGFSAASGDWLMYVDADEEVSEELAVEIASRISSAEAADGYCLARKSMIFGRWIYNGGWFPDYTARLFRRGRYAPQYAEVHGGFRIIGRQEKLNGFLLHYTYGSIEQYLEKMNDYTSLQVSEKIRGSSGAKSIWRKVLFSPLSHFFRKYVSNRGYRDGIHGFILASLGAIYTLALYSKVWEYRMRAGQGTGSLPPVTNKELQLIKRPVA